MDEDENTCVHDWMLSHINKIWFGFDLFSFQILSITPTGIWVDRLYYLKPSVKEYFQINVYYPSFESAMNKNEGQGIWNIRGRIIRIGYWDFSLEREFSLPS